MALNGQDWVHFSELLFIRCIIWGSEKERDPSKLTQLGREETCTCIQG